MLNYVNERIDIVPPDNRVDISIDFEEMAMTLLTLAKRIRALFGMALAGAGYHNGQDQLLACLVPGERISVSLLLQRSTSDPRQFPKCWIAWLRKD